MRGNSIGLGKILTGNNAANLSQYWRPEVITSKLDATMDGINPKCGQRTVMLRLKPSMVEQGLFKGDADHSSFLAELDALEKNSGNSTLAWRHGLSSAVSDFSMRTRELKNWIERLVLPTRSKRGRG